MYVPKYKLAIEVDELGHCTRDIKSEIERQNKIEKELDCKFIRIDPSRKNFDIIDEFCRIKKHHQVNKKKCKRQNFRCTTRFKIKKKQLSKNKVFKMDC